MTSLRVWECRLMYIFNCLNSYRHVWNTHQGDVAVDIRTVWPGNSNLTFTSFARQKYLTCSLMTHRKPNPQTNSLWLVMKWHTYDSPVTKKLWVGLTWGKWHVFYHQYVKPPLTFPFTLLCVPLHWWVMMEVNLNSSMEVCLQDDRNTTRLSRSQCGTDSPSPLCVLWVCPW